MRSLILILPLVFGAGCDEVPPALVSLPEIDDAKIDAALAFGLCTCEGVSGGGVAPAPTPAPVGPYKCATCRDKGVITHGDGHTTPCPDCQPSVYIPAIDDPIRPEKLTGCGCGNPECQCIGPNCCGGDCAKCKPVKEEVMQVCALRLGSNTPTHTARYTVGGKDASGRVYKGDLGSGKFMLAGYRAPCTNGNCPVQQAPAACEGGACEAPRTFQGACGDGSCAGFGATARWYPGKRIVAARPLRRVAGFFQRVRPLRRAAGFIFRGFRCRGCR